MKWGQRTNLGSSKKNQEHTNVPARACTFRKKELPKKINLTTKDLGEILKEGEKRNYP